MANTVYEIGPYVYTVESCKSDNSQPLMDLIKELLRSSYDDRLTEEAGGALGSEGGNE